MPVFDNLFSETTDRPVFYNGQPLLRMDRINVANGQKLKVTFESVNSDWRQGIGFDTDGSFDVVGKTIKHKIVLWRDTAPEELHLVVHTKKGECLVKNVWDVGDGVVQSWHNGAAMIVEELPSGRRYRCNDGYPDDDFDDLVFRLEWSVTAPCHDNARIR